AAIVFASVPAASKSSTPTSIGPVSRVVHTTSVSRSVCLIAWKAATSWAGCASANVGSRVSVTPPQAGGAQATRPARAELIFVRVMEGARSRGFRRAGPGPWRARERPGGPTYACERSRVALGGPVEHRGRVSYAEARRASRSCAPVPGDAGAPAPD